MISFTYAKCLQNICLGICLAIFSLPASAMCFYNKMKPKDFTPDGYTLSQDDKTVQFFYKGGRHQKNVSINQHQCINDGKETVDADVFHLGPFTVEGRHMADVEANGAVVIKTESLNPYTKGAKYFKLIANIYSGSNALQQSWYVNMKCTAYTSVFGNHKLYCVYYL